VAVAALVPVEAGAAATVPATTRIAAAIAGALICILKSLFK
jgi:hypothetical protein